MVFGFTYNKKKATIHRYSAIFLSFWCMQPLETGKGIMKEKTCRASASLVSFFSCKRNAGMKLQVSFWFANLL